MSLQSLAKKFNFKNGFPWQIRIFAWILLSITIIISASFTTFYGIQFGNESCMKWISAMFISFFSSVWLIEPIKVLLLASLYSMLFQKSYQFDLAHGVLDDEKIENYFDNKSDCILNQTSNQLHQIANEGIT